MRSGLRLIETIEHWPEAEDDEIIDKKGSSMYVNLFKSNSDQPRSFNEISPVNVQAVVMNEVTGGGSRMHVLRKFRQQKLLIRCLSADGQAVCSRHLHHGGALPA